MAAAGRARRTSRPSCSPSPTSAPTRRASAPPPTPTEDGGLRPQRPQAVGDQRRDRRHRRRDGRRCPKSDGHRGGITAFVLPYDTDGVTVEHRNAVHGPARASRTRSRCFEDVFVPDGEPDRQGGPGPQDRAHHAQHRPPRAAGDLRRRRPSGRRRSRASGRPSASSGASRSASTTRSRRRSRSSPRTAFGLEAMLDVASAAWPTTSATTSASRPRSPSSTARSWAGRSSTS